MSGWSGSHRCRPDVHFYGMKLYSRRSVCNARLEQSPTPMCIRLDLPNCSGTAQFTLRWSRQSATVAIVPMHLH